MAIWLMIYSPLLQKPVLYFCTRLAWPLLWLYAQYSGLLLFAMPLIAQHGPCFGFLLSFLLILACRFSLCSIDKL